MTWLSRQTRKRELPLTSHDTDDDVTSNNCVTSRHDDASLNNVTSSSMTPNGMTSIDLGGNLTSTTSYSNGMTYSDIMTSASNGHVSGLTSQLSSRTRSEGELIKEKEERRIAHTSGIAGTCIFWFVGLASLYTGTVYILPYDYRWVV